MVLVDHGILLDRLKVYGVAGETMKWFQSYLADRFQLVHLGGCVSDVALMKHGVPQGSILGPLFFTVFINDLPLHVSSYADDTTITSSGDCGSMGRLQEHLYQKFLIGHWATGFHPKKKRPGSSP